MDFYNHKLTKSDITTQRHQPVISTLRVPKYKSVFDQYATVVYTSTRYVSTADEITNYAYRNYEISDDYTAPQTMTGDDYPTISLPMDVQDAHASVGDLIFTDAVRGYLPDGQTLSDRGLMLCVVGIDADNDTVDVKAINGKKIGNVKGCVPSIDSGELFYWCGRMEIDNMSANSFIPRGHTVNDDNNYCQNFTQIVSAEKSAIIALNEKGYGFSMKDMVRMGQSDLKRGRDFSFLYSAPSDIYQTNLGLWYQAGHTFRYSSEAEGTPSERVDALMRALGSYSAKDYICLGGRDFEAWFLRVFEDAVLNDDGTYTIKCSEGTIKFILSPLFEEGPYPANGLIFPKDELIKYVYQPYTEVYSKDGLTCTISECAALGFKAPLNTLRIIKR